MLKFDLCWKITKEQKFGKMWVADRLCKSSLSSVIDLWTSPEWALVFSIYDMGRETRKRTIKGEKRFSSNGKSTGLSEIWGWKGNDWVWNGMVGRDGQEG